MIFNIIIARNFVSRNNRKGQLCTEKKKWNEVYSDTIYVNNIVGNLIGTAYIATNDSYCINYNIKIEDKIKTTKINKGE